MPHVSKRIVDGLYGYIWQGNGNNCNTYVFADVLPGKRPHAIVDPGFVRNEFREACFDSLVDSMNRDGLAVEDIGLVINTHTHPDHCQATEAIVERTFGPEDGSPVRQAIVALSREEEDYYLAAGENMFGMFGMEVPELGPLFYLAEGDLVLGGGNRVVQLQVFLSPGHSPGSVCLYWPENRVLITGDVLFFGSVGRTDFPGGSAATLKKSIERLSELDVEYVLPGHSTEFGSVVEGREFVRRNFAAVRYLF